MNVSFAYQNTATGATEKCSYNSNSKFQIGELPSFCHPNKSFRESEMLMDLLQSNCRENYRLDPLEECNHICTIDCLLLPYHASPHNPSSELWYQYIRPLEVETQAAL